MKRSSSVNRPVLGLDDYRCMSARLRAARIAQPVTVRLWNILNLFRDPAAQVMDPATRGALSLTGTELLFIRAAAPDGRAPRRAGSGGYD